MKFAHCIQCRNEVLKYAIVVNITQMLFKATLSLLSGSAALMADALHSSADIIATAVSMVSLKVSSKPPDEEHPFGHGKVQFISSSIVGMILISGSVWMLINALSSIVKGDYSAPGGIALIGATLSIMVNEVMFRYQRCVAVELSSPAIMANAWDNRSDALSSVAVLIGLVFAVFGYPIADPLASVGLSLLVAKIGLELNVEAVKGLMDSMPDRDDLRTIYQIVKKAPGILGIVFLRARISGETLYAEINVRVDANLKVYEGDLIVEMLKDKIKQSLDTENCEIQVFLTPLEVTEKAKK